MKRLVTSALAAAELCLGAADGMGETQSPGWAQPHGQAEQAVAGRFSPTIAARATR